MKTKINISEIIDLNKRLSEINLMCFDEIDYIDENGKSIEIPDNMRDDWKYTGLSNTDFITTNYFKFY